MSKKLGIVSAAFVLTSFLVGCGAADPTAPSETAPAAETLAEGLTVLKSTNEQALNIAFKESGVVIYIQALRGKLAPTEYQGTDGKPVYEVDARFVADNGRAFYVRRGGDEWVDPSWPKDFDKQADLPPTRVSNEKLFKMAARAAELMDVELPKQLDAAKLAVHLPELAAVKDFGREALPTFAEQHLRALDHTKELGQSITEVPYGDMGGPDVANVTMASNYYYMAVYDGDISMTFGTGKHSATRLYQWSGAWFTAYDSCNHGRCPGIDGMGLKCNLNYYEALENVKPAFELQTCKTGYDALSNGGGHNCHDDSRVQMANFIYGKTNNGSQAWCADGDSSADISGGFEQGGSPECSSYNRKGFNHPSWCQYNGGGEVKASWFGDGYCDCNYKFPENVSGTVYNTWADSDCRNR